MAKRQERSVIENLIDSANLDELARLSGMSEDAFIDELTRGVTQTNLSALELDRKQYIDALASAVRQDDRDKKKVAKIVKQLRNASPEQRAALQRRLGIPEVRSEDPNRQNPGRSGPIRSQVGVDRDGRRRIYLNETPQARLKRIIAQLGGASNRVVQVPGTDATNSTGLVPLMGHDSLRDMEEERTFDDAALELRNVFGLDVTDLRDVSDDEKRAMDMADKLEGRAPQMPSNAARSNYIVNDETEADKIARQNNVIHVGGGFEPILVADGQPLGGFEPVFNKETKELSYTLLPGAAADRFQEISAKISYFKSPEAIREHGSKEAKRKVARLYREAEAVEEALAKTRRSYDFQSMSPRVWMNKDQAELEGISTYGKQTIGDDVRVDTESLYTLGAGRGAREVQRNIDIETEIASRRDSDALRDYATRAASGQLTGPELERYIRKVQQSSFAGDTSDPQVVRYLQSEVPQITDRYLANQDDALSSYLARVAANEDQARFDREVAFLANANGGSVYLDDINDLVTADYYTPSGEAGSREIILGKKGEPAFFEQVNYAIRPDDAQLREDGVYVTKQGAPIVEGVGVGSPDFDADADIRIPRTGGIAPISSEELEVLKDTQAVVQDYRKRDLAVTGLELADHLAEQRGLSRGEALKRLDSRRIRLGVGQSAQEFLDYTSVPLIAGAEKQIDVNGILGKLSRDYANLVKDPSVFVDGRDSLQVMADDINRLTPQPQVGGMGVNRIVGKMGLSAKEEGVRPGIQEALNRLNYDVNQVQDVARAINLVEQAYRGSMSEVNQSRKANGPYFTMPQKRSTENVPIIRVERPDGTHYYTAENVVNDFNQDVSLSPELGTKYGNTQWADQNLGKVTKHTEVDGKGVQGIFRQMGQDYYVGAPVGYAGGMKDPSQLIGPDGEGSFRNETGKSGFGQIFVAEETRPEGGDKFTGRAMTIKEQMVDRLKSTLTNQGRQALDPSYLNENGAISLDKLKKMSDQVEKIKDRLEEQGIPARTLGQTELKAAAESTLKIPAKNLGIALRAQTALGSADAARKQYEAVQTPVSDLRVSPDLTPGTYGQTASGIIIQTDDVPVDFFNSGLQDAIQIENEQASALQRGQIAEERKLRDLYNYGASSWNPDYVEGGEFTNRNFVEVPIPEGADLSEEGLRKMGAALVAPKGGGVPTTMVIRQDLQPGRMFAGTTTDAAGNVTIEGTNDPIARRTVRRSNFDGNGGALLVERGSGSGVFPLDPISGEIGERIKRRTKGSGVNPSVPIPQRAMPRTEGRTIQSAPTFPSSDPRSGNFQISLSDAGKTMRGLALEREIAERFDQPMASPTNPKVDAIQKSLEIADDDLEYVNIPSGANNEISYAVDPDGVKVPLGKGYDGGSTEAARKSMLQDPNANAGPIAREQAPDVTNSSFKAETPPPTPPRQPPAPTPSPEPSPANARRRFDLRRLGIGAAGAGLTAAAGGTLNSLINGERQQREQR